MYLEVTLTDNLKDFEYEEIENIRIVGNFEKFDTIYCKDLRFTENYYFLNAEKISLLRERAKYLVDLKGFDYRKDSKFDMAVFKFVRKHKLLKLKKEM